MVPLDVPSVALQMIHAFVQHASLQTAASKLGSIDSSLSAACEPRRSLMEMPAFTNVSKFPANHAPVIAHTHALADSAQIRLRLQPIQHVNNNDLIVEHVALRGEPGSIAIPIDTNLFNSSHSHLDILITGLTPGVEYSFSIDPSASRRAHKLIVGCYRPGYSQCCHHGLCALGDAGKAYCKCDIGYTGEYCNHYLVAPHDQMVTDNHTLISGDSMQCSAKTINFMNTLVWNANGKSNVANSVVMNPVETAVSSKSPSLNVCGGDADDCCVETEVSLLASTTINDGIVEKWQALKALFEHDVASTMEAAKIENVFIAIRSGGMVRGEAVVHMLLCGDEDIILTAIQEIRKELSNSQSVLRSGIITGRLSPEHFDILRSGPAEKLQKSYILMEESIEQKELGWWWLILLAGPIGLLMIYFSYQQRRPLSIRNTPDRLPIIFRN
jgi:hypothetical protein